MQNCRARILLMEAYHNQSSRKFRALISMQLQLIASDFITYLDLIKPSQLKPYGYKNYQINFSSNLV